jgi:hypothetical protein
MQVRAQEQISGLQEPHPRDAHGALFIHQLPYRSGSAVWLYWSTKSEENGT